MIKNKVIKIFLQFTKYNKKNKKNNQINSKDIIIFILNKNIKNKNLIKN